MPLIILLGMYGGWSIIKDIANFHKSKGDFDERNFYMRMIMKEIALIIGGVFAFIMLVIKVLEIIYH